MKRLATDATIGQLPTFADYRRMRLLHPRRDPPMSDKEVQEQTRNTAVETEAVVTEEGIKNAQDTVSKVQAL